MSKRYVGVHLRKDGRYEKRFTIDRKRYSVFGHSCKECIEKELIRRKEIAEHRYVKNQNVTVNQYFNEWIIQKEQEVKATTVRLYKIIYKNQIAPIMGTRKIQDLERRELVSFQSKLGQQYTTATTKKAINIIKQLLESAVIDGITTVNAAEYLPQIKKKSNERVARETIHRALTEEELKLFLKYAQTDWNYNAICLLLATGMRAGELGALYWSDIDYKNNVIHITKTVTVNQNGKSIIGTTPKTQKSKRDIPLNVEIRDILSKQRNFISMWTGKRIIKLNDTVFNAEMQGIIYAKTINNSIKRILKRIEEIEIKPFTAHAFRSTFASMAVKKGMPLNVLKEIMGHASYSMTADLYGHIYDEQKQESMEDVKIIMM